MGVSCISLNKHKFKIRGERVSLVLSNTVPEGTGRAALIRVKQHKLGELWRWTTSPGRAHPP